MSSSIPHSSSGAFRSNNNNSSNSNSNNNGPPPPTAFEAQREELIREIAMVSFHYHIRLRSSVYIFEKNE
jgi:hypothetical protein